MSVNSSTKDLCRREEFLTKLLSVLVACLHMTNGQLAPVTLDLNVDLRAFHEITSAGTSSRIGGRER